MMYRYRRWPISQNLFAYACQPGSNPCVSNGNPIVDIVNYQAPDDSGGGAPQNTFNMVHRVDYNLSNKTTIFGRYALLHQNLFDGFLNNSPWTGFDTGQTQRNQNALFSVTHVWNPRIVTDSKISYNRLTLQQHAEREPSRYSPTLYFNVNFDETIQGVTTCLVGYSCTTPGNSIPLADRRTSPSSRSPLVSTRASTTCVSEGNTSTRKTTAPSAHIRTRCKDSSRAAMVPWRPH